MKSPCLVYITFPSFKDAEKLARILIEKDLAACVNIFPAVQSLFKWEGKIVQADETVLIAKTVTDNEQALIQCVLQNHPYDCPALVTIPVKGGHAAFIEWVTQQAYLQESPPSCS